MLQQKAFALNAAGIAGQLAACAHNTVARNDDGNRVVTHRAAHSARRAAANHLCQFTVSHRPAVRNVFCIFLCMID